MPRRTKSSPLDEVFAALANPTRRDILDALLKQELSAGDLAAKFDMARASVSEHLRALRETGLIEERQDGRFRYYSMSADPLATLFDWLSPYERFWRERFNALNDVLDRMED
ncbi:ArsR/SmtB family transcription factor [Glutamicibacter mishrai]|uniref:ArsR family transcriptional regulator n=1 Tax=Glutamicibacter mishrai TaxID=1775880 RepID=A0A6H0SLS8_9MICC|nr:metalloregulator ArsR/SmtB family transcription factor [Glutamicibacter mishrai]QIV88358.1 ArsR family transcriptional regulator [Glutamicibacter mishrai]